MRNLQVLFLFFVLSVCIGCLGVGSRSVDQGAHTTPLEGVALSGRVYFADRQLYGSIPVTARDATGRRITTVQTDSSGFFAFTDIPDGIYDIVALTGESETVFAKNQQIQADSPRQLSEIALLGIRDSVIDQITSSSFRLTFRTNRAARATVEYGPLGGYSQLVTLGQSGVTRQQTTITGLKPLTDYEVTLYLTGDDGQDFIMRGLYATTIGPVGPKNLSVTINEGVFETRSQNVTLNLEADGATQMRIGESLDLSESAWITYSQEYSYSFASTSEGTKRVYVQFRDASDNESSIQSAKILLNNKGYVGLWIEDGAALTNKTSVSVKIVYPGAINMQLSNSVDFLNSFWEPYLESRIWRFDPGDGTKTIYARFRGGSANEQEVFTASVNLDTTPPEVEILINNGAEYTASTSVQLSFSVSAAPAQMKLRNSEPPQESAQWISYQNPYNWSLTSGDGEKEVFGLFRDAAGNQFGPVSTLIELDTIPPAGNSFAIRADDNVTSEEIDYVLLASYPIFIHFDVADEGTEKAEFGFSKRTASAPTDIITVSTPFIPYLLNEAILPVGNYKVWCRFIDKAGNKSFYQSANIKVDGPQLIVTPEAVALRSAGEQQFTATPENIGAEDYGNIRWLIESGSGTIDVTGLYTAPAPVFTTSSATIRAEYTGNPDLHGIAVVNLGTQVEMLFLNDEAYEYEAEEIVVSPGEAGTATVIILHGSQGSSLVRQLSQSEGVMSVGSPVQQEFGISNTYSYKAPNSTPPENPVKIGVRALEDHRIVGTLSFLVSEGPNISLSPSAGEAQRHRPLNISATVVNTASRTMNWEITPANFGSFEATNPAVTSKTSIEPNHVVTFYPALVSQRTRGQVIARIDGAEKIATITVVPPIRFDISPQEVSALPIIEPIDLVAQSFENIGASSEEVTWEFRNYNRTDAEYSPADGRTFPDRGSLTIVNETTAQYRRPSMLPSQSDPANADKIIVRATSVADPLASTTAIINITENVVVRIFDSVERENQVFETSTVAEVGKLRFYASVSPEEIGDTSVTWTVNDTPGDDQVGSIDENGLYTAPDLVTFNKVTIKATSNYDTSVATSVVVNLGDFWIPRRSSMVDATSGTPMPVTTLLIDPTTSVGSDFLVFAGTDGYGVWVATFSDQPGNNTGGFWQPVSGLSTVNRNDDGRMNIEQLTISPDNNIYAATLGGIWRITRPPTVSATQISSTLSAVPESKFYNLAFNKDINANTTYMFAATPRGVYKLTMTANPNLYSNSFLLIDTYHAYRVRETRTDDTASPAAEIAAYSDTLTANPINNVMETIVYNQFSDRLFSAGEGGTLVLSRNHSIPNLEYITDRVFDNPAPNVEFTVRGLHVLTTTQPGQTTIGSNNLVRHLAIDPVNRNTMWAATVAGVYRSVNSGEVWAPSTFGTGSNVNTRTIIVDPTNTINVMAGSEDGLYRSTDAGTSWKRIRSGLGEHKTITSLIQAPGTPGVRRKVWVGTSGGVFMGRQSLDLE